VDLPALASVHQSLAAAALALLARALLVLSQVAVVQPARAGTAAMLLFPQLLVQLAALVVAATQVVVAAAVLAARIVRAQEAMGQNMTRLMAVAVGPAVAGLLQLQTPQQVPEEIMALVVARPLRLQRLLLLQGKAQAA
jgi:hypothetical protein